MKSWIIEARLQLKWKKDPLSKYNVKHTVI